MKTACHLLQNPQPNQQFQLSQVLSPARCMSVTWEKNKIFVLAPAGSGKLRLHTPNHISNKVRTTTNTITPISPRKHATHKNSCACCCCCRLHFPWWLNCPSSPCHIKHTEFDYEQGQFRHFPYPYPLHVHIHPSTSMVTNPTTILDSGRKLVDKNALQQKGIFVPLKGTRMEVAVSPSKHKNIKVKGGHLSQNDLKRWVC